MKKIIINLLFLIFSFLIVAQASASTEDIVKNIFKVKSYNIDDINNKYNYSQYGSSVYIWNNKLITNAHVILDEDKKLVWNYEICKSTDFTSTPDCFTTAKVLYYSIEDDIALLELDWSFSLGNWVAFSGKELELSDSVKVYWYPSNWWYTITFTEWKISGYSEWYYKMDANLDSWNSGWWAFDENDKLIGIPTQVSMGYTTLGMIIPMDKVNKFLAKSTSDIKYNNELTKQNFKDYISDRQADLKKNNISNDYFHIDNLGKYGFETSNLDYDNDKEIVKYLLYSKTWSKKTSVTIYNLKWYGDMTEEESDKVNKKAEESIKESASSSEVINFKKLKLMWRDFYVTVMKSWNNLNLDFSTGNNGYNIYYNISSSIDDIEWLKKALIMLLIGMKYDLPLEWEIYTTMDLWDITFKTWSGQLLSKSMYYAGIIDNTIYIYDNNYNTYYGSITNQELSLSDTEKSLSSKIDKKFIDDLMTYLEYYYDTSEYKVLKDNLGNNILYILGANSKWDITLSYSLFLSKDDETIKQYSILFRIPKKTYEKWDNSNITKILEDFIKNKLVLNNETITIVGANPAVDIESHIDIEAMEEAMVEVKE